MKNRIASIVWGACLILAIGIATGWTGSAILYTLNTSPSSSDHLLGFDDPGGDWSMQRYLISDLIQMFYSDATYGLLDEDTMATDSESRGATQQSIKAYVDTTVTGQFEDTPSDSETSKGPTSNWAYDHENAADPHPVYRLESEMGTASLRAAEDTVTDGANLPDGAAVIDRIESGVTGTLNSLSNGGYLAVDYLTLTAGEDITLTSYAGFPQVYFKYDGVNSGGRVFLYNADSTATAKDTYPVIGFAVSTATTGNSVTVRVEGMLARRDDFSTLTGNQDEGKPIYAGTTGAGLQSLVQPTTADDDVTRLGFVMQVDGSGGTGDYILYSIPRVSVTVPSS